MSEEEHITFVQKKCEQINRSAYKTLSEFYKKKMNAGEIEALQKYSELLQLAKKHNIK